MNQKSERLDGCIKVHSKGCLFFLQELVVFQLLFMKMEDRDMKTKT